MFRHSLDVEGGAAMDVTFTIRLIVPCLPASFIA
jgi:hypothetical protein